MGEHFSDKLSVRKFIYVIKGRKRKLIIEIVIVSDGRNYGNIVPFGDKQCYLRNKKVIRKTEKHTFGRKLIQPRKKFFAAPILPFPNKFSDKIDKILLYFHSVSKHIGDNIRLKKEES